MITEKEWLELVKDFQKASNGFQRVAEEALCQRDELRCILAKILTQQNEDSDPAWVRFVVPEAGLRWWECGCCKKYVMEDSGDWRDISHGVDCSVRIGLGML